MTFTYNSSQINTTSTNASLMRVRFLVHDISTGDQLVDDESIQWVLSDYPNVFEAASIVARSIAGIMSQRPDSKTVQDATMSWQGRAREYMTLAKDLEKKAKSPSNRSIAAYSGGISKSDKDAIANETDWARPGFAVGMQSYPGTKTVDWIEPST